jgi:formate-dependent nitrite reductase membrane component NrfD
VLLTLDLGQPLRFWHMLVDTTPGQLGPVFKYWSPMSVGAWALVIYGFFAPVAFLEALGWLRLGGFGRFLSVLGAIAGLFIAGYTGVLLSVSNQPVWSDTWGARRALPRLRAVRVGRAGRLAGPPPARRRRQRRRTGPQ